MDKKRFVIRSSIALSYNDGKMEFFKTNVRENIVLEIKYNLIDFLRQFDGKTEFDEILEKSKFDKKDLGNLIYFLQSKNIIIEVDKEYDSKLITENYRLINFLEECCFSTSEVLEVLETLSKKAVLVVGLGGVGSWVVDILARSGVKNFVLVDNDKVELSNLHRQDFFTPNDVGKFKIDCIDESIVCKKHYKL